MFWLFGGKREVEGVKEETRKGFDSVKKDINAVSGWIKHLDSEKKLHSKDIAEIKAILSTIHEEIEGLKNIVSVMNEIKPKPTAAKNKQLAGKQTAVYAVQTGVQTGVQTPNLDVFSVTERAIIWILLHSDMKLSSDDLAAMLGKEKSTIRGQLNSIKQKGELIMESVEKNGKKRVFIPDEIKEKLLKKEKVRVRKGKKA
jgi:hypothetical protein|tara:strand:+ start:8652 stop:9251 length:600 start_codon:yes stop_codon:yes gene_type:complete